MKNKKTIISSIITMACVLCILGISLYFVLRKTDTAHIESNGIQIKLIRTKLSKFCLDSDGHMQTIIDEAPKDFTKANQENVFGLTDGDIVVPSSRYQADLSISASDNKSFAYWIEIYLNQGNAFSDQLLVTIIKPNGIEESARLSKANLFGNEQEPLVIVSNGEISSISVKVYFVDDQIINDDAINQSIYFDLILCAVEVNV